MMHPTTIQIFVLAIVQGLAELLPISSSAHVILVEKFLGLDPTVPEMTFLLVMLHTGTMFAVIAYFWSRWKKLFLSSPDRGRIFAMLILATGVTGVVGLALKHIIEKYVLSGQDIEALFANMELISISLFAAGILILVSGMKRWKPDPSKTTLATSAIIGLVQGLCLPFRGFSRSGATISTGLILGMSKTFAEDFSFMLAVLLTPPVILREVMRLRHFGNVTISTHTILNGTLGMGLSFVAGIVAIWWLSKWLEKGRWSYFGIYCFGFSALVFVLNCCSKATFLK